MEMKEKLSQFWSKNDKPDSKDSERGSKTNADGEIAQKIKNKAAKKAGPKIVLVRMHDVRAHMRRIRSGIRIFIRKYFRMAHLRRIDRYARDKRFRQTSMDPYLWGIPL